MLQEHLEDVLHLEDLAHPRRTQVHFVHIPPLTVVRAVEPSAGLTTILVNLGCGGAGHHLVDLVAAVFLHERDLKLEVLLFTLLRRTSPLLDCLDEGLEAIEVASDRLTASQPSEELKLVASDCFITL